MTAFDGHNPLELPPVKPVPFEVPAVPAFEAPAPPPAFVGHPVEDPSAREMSYDAFLSIVQAVYSAETPHPFTGKTNVVEVVRAADYVSPHLTLIEDGAARPGLLSVEVPPDHTLEVGDPLIVLPARPNQIPLGVMPGQGEGGGSTYLAVLHECPQLDETPGHEGCWYAVVHKLLDNVEQTQDLMARIHPGQWTRRIGQVCYITELKNDFYPYGVIDIISIPVNVESTGTYTAVSTSSLAPRQLSSNPEACSEP
jgi:hypothetical protein